jgi:hypothetical protein
MEKAESNFKKLFYWLMYMAAMLGLSHVVWWIKTNTLIPEIFKGIGVILMIFSVIPGVLLAKKLLGTSKARK